MTDYEYIVQQVKKFHYSGWNASELRKYPCENRFWTPLSSNLRLI